MSSKRRLSQNLTDSANKLKLNSINKILKIDSVKGKKNRKDAISKQVSRIALAELVKNSPFTTRVVAPDFKDFMMHEDNVKVFREFLEASYCQENLDFYLACEKYRKLDPDRVGKQMIKFMVTQIYNDFLSESARQPVNVDSGCIERIKANMMDPPNDLLRDAQAEIFNLMKTDCYPRFCKTWQLDGDLARKILLRSVASGSQEQSTQQTFTPLAKQSHNLTSSTIETTRKNNPNGSYLSQRTTSSRSRTPFDTSSSTSSGCPPECPYYRIGRLPCQQHQGSFGSVATQRAMKRGPDVDEADHLMDLKRIHKVPELRNKRSAPPPPLPPKPDEIDHTRPYLPYVGKVFEV